MVVFLSGIAPKEEENELGDDDLACVVLVLGRSRGEEGILEDVSWLAWLLDLCSWPCGLSNCSEKTRNWGVFVFR